jgi:hypothetical protein
VHINADCLCCINSCRQRGPRFMHHRKEKLHRRQVGIVVSFGDSSVGCSFSVVIFVDSLDSTAMSVMSRRSSQCTALTGIANPDERLDVSSGARATTASNYVIYHMLC